MFSYDDELDYVVNSNIAVLMAGFSLLFVYVALVLGNLNLVEQRVSNSLFFSSNYIIACCTYVVALSNFCHRHHLWLSLVLTVSCLFLVLCLFQWLAFVREIIFCCVVLSLPLAERVHVILLLLCICLIKMYIYMSLIFVCL